mmetsp:Transcript_19727/g.40241  ORF Transcript_19727/g.40241 Transcript_19727/m.40241 type:complete len:351 (+) Transcript_19727:350-1402(+)
MPPSPVGVVIGVLPEGALRVLVARRLRGVEAFLFPLCSSRQDRTSGDLAADGGLAGGGHGCLAVRVCVASLLVGGRAHGPDVDVDHVGALHVEHVGAPLAVGVDRQRGLGRARGVVRFRVGVGVGGEVVAADAVVLRHPWPRPPPVRHLVWELVRGIGTVEVRVVLLLGAALLPLLRQRLQRVVQVGDLLAGLLDLVVVADVGKVRDLLQPLQPPLGGRVHTLLLLLQPRCRAPASVLRGKLALERARKLEEGGARGARALVRAQSPRAAACHAVVGVAHPVSARLLLVRNVPVVGAEVGVPVAVLVGEHVRCHIGVRRELGGPTAGWDDVLRLRRELAAVEGGDLRDGG